MLPYFTLFDEGMEKDLLASWCLDVLFSLLCADAEILYKSLSSDKKKGSFWKDRSMAGGGAPYRNLNMICLLNMKVLSNTGNYSDRWVPVVILDANYDMSVGLGLTTLWKQMAETSVTSSYFMCAVHILSLKKNIFQLSDERTWSCLCVELWHERVRRIFLIKCFPSLTCCVSHRPPPALTISLKVTGFRK